MKSGCSLYIHGLNVLHLHKRDWSGNLYAGRNQPSEMAISSSLELIYYSILINLWVFTLSSILERSYFTFLLIGFYREILVIGTGKNDDHAQHWFFENYFNFCQSCVMRVSSEEWSALRMLTILNVFLINATWMLFNSKKILKSRRNPLITLNSVYSTNSSVDFNSWSWMVQWFLDRKKNVISDTFATNFRPIVRWVHCFLLFIWNKYTQVSPSMPIRLIQSFDWLKDTCPSNIAIKLQSIFFGRVYCVIYCRLSLRSV